MKNYNNICATNISSNEATVEAKFIIYLYELVVPVIFSVVTLFGLAGNIFVICVILSKKHMKNSLNILLLNLAIADILFLVFCVPLTIYHQASPSWNLGAVTCRMSSYPYFLSNYVTMYTLVVISIWRYMTVIHSTRTGTKRNIRMAIVCVITLWIIMAVINIPTLFMNDLKLVKDDCSTPYIYCGSKDMELTKAFYLAYFICGYAIPLLFMICLYVALLCYVKGNTVVPRTRKVTILVVLVVSAFGICWLPLHIHLLIAYYSSSPPSGTYYHVIRIVCQFLAYSNSFMNPLIYNLTSKSFRESMFDLLPSHCIQCKLRRYIGRNAVEPIYDMPESHEALVLTQVSPVTRRYMSGGDRHVMCVTRC